MEEGFITKINLGKEEVSYMICNNEGGFITEMNLEEDGGPYMICNKTFVLNKLFTYVGQMSSNLIR